MQTTNKHYLTVTERKLIEVSGIKDIKRYDSEKIVLDIGDSILVLCGKDFNIKKFDVESELAQINGCIDSVIYDLQDNISKKSFLKSLFK